MEIVTALIGQVGIPLLAVALVVSAIVVVTNHLSKPKVPPYVPEHSREFISDHPVAPADPWSDGRGGY